MGNLRSFTYLFAKYYRIQKVQSMIFKNLEDYNTESGFYIKKKFS